MAARSIDAAEGYRAYMEHNAALELDEINEHLRGLGLREVSPRMLLHYRRLYRHGYRSYIPIIGEVDGSPTRGRGKQFSAGA